MHIRPVLRVQRPQVLRCVLDGSQLARESDIHHADESARLDKLNEVAQVALVRAEVEEGVDGDHDVEELLLRMAGYERPPATETHSPRTPAQPPACSSRWAKSLRRPPMPRS